MGERTPPQTIGPFFADALLRDPMNAIAGPGVAGERVRIEGRVLDGDGLPVQDALVEVWQADANGEYPRPVDGDGVSGGFLGFGRSGTDRDGRYWFDTVKPGPVPGPGGGLQAPHLNVQVFARGLLDRLSTRIYFEGEPANGADVVLAAVPGERRGTLLARRGSAPEGTPSVYRFDVVLQGPGETVFFDA